EWDESRRAIVAEVRRAERAAEAAINVAAAPELAVPVAGNRVDGRRAEVIFNRAAEVPDRKLLEIYAVGMDFVALEIAAVNADQPVRPLVGRVGTENARSAVVLALLARQPDRQWLARSPL